MPHLQLKLSRWGTSSYETPQTIQREKDRLKECVQIVDDDSDADIIVVHSKLKVDERIIERCPSLKYVITTTSGYDHIDVPLLRSKNITAIRMPLLRRDAVVETTLGLILQGTRRIQDLRCRGIQDGWLRHELPQYELMELKDQRIGIIGSSGVIGSKMVEILEIMGCKNIFCCDIKNHSTTNVSIQDIAECCNIISLHCNLNDSSYHLCDASFFSTLQKGSILINTARGGLIDESEVFRAIENHTLSFLGLDVFEKEPYGDIGVQKNYKNVVLLPHAAGFSNNLLQNITEQLYHVCHCIVEEKNIPYIISA